MIRIIGPGRIEHHLGMIFESVVCLPWGVRIGAHHMSSWGVRMELLRIAMGATCYQGEGSLQCPPFNLPILPGQNERVKNDCF